VAGCPDHLKGAHELLRHGVIRRDGTVHLVGNGRANHAGGGDPDVLAAVIAENYGTRPPATNEHQGSDGAVDGNARFYGFECENLGDGKDPWPAVQVEAMVRASAALARALDWGAKSVIGHLEWSDWKSDPKGPDNVVAMPGLRLRIAERLLHPASWNPGTKPQPAPLPPTPMPTPPSGVLVPNLSTLTRTEDLTLIANNPQYVYWTTEAADEPNQHGDGGRTFLQNTEYTGRIDLEIEGLTADDYVEVRTMHEPTGGTPYAVSVTQIDGRGDGTTRISRAIPITGRVGADRLSIQVTSQAGQPVTLAYAKVTALSWA
jgi:hypothetical protein